jgi:hypothetical protein
MNNHLPTKQLNMEKKITNYGIRNPGAGLGQAQQSGRVKPVNGIPNLPLFSMYALFYDMALVLHKHILDL